ncbi:ComEC/Rec2 family competence protein [Brevundimonas variabilis]|uniref:Competence protein ComEC n=1 Tax=Brevundimonas variabilis TaxID=74312 RepID=A0A7W9CI23_9CAUL|nr:ComEC/Rec2 family competence protein [Brevundimonas variabilis]MBB5745773.1 competence protein ComEC [Brevundimonas variabilis]
MKGTSEGAALIPFGTPKPSVWTWFRTTLRAEILAQGLRWRLWAPVAFGGGCGLYFALKTEPSLWPLLMVTVLACGLWLAARASGQRRVVTLPMMLLACLSLGVTTSKVRADRVAGPVAPALSEPATVMAWVIDVDSPGANGARVVIAPVHIQGLSPKDTPLRLRTTVRGEPPPPGAPVRLFAIINPPPPPASPGAYDFARGAYFQGLGGVAFALSDTLPTALPPPPWRLRLEMRINAIRYALAQQIVARLGERTGGVAAAMVTGHEAWIGKETLEDMRDSGLAHILSISGLHMAIVGGFTFFGVRLLVAGWPWLALRVSGKKLAAVAGLVAVGTYLILSGSPPPAERAAITASIAFAAILLDRQALTMHALGVAAFAVLLLQPEAIVTPGFQMSFAATAALVALVEVWPRRTQEISVPWPVLVVQRLISWGATAMTASLVAGLATGPFAMQHFNRVAVYGLVANMATSPLADFVMMPMLALGAALEPVGLGGPFLWVAGTAVEAMLAIGSWVADLPGAVQTIPSAPDVALPIAFLGILFICLWKGQGRWLGLPFAAAVLIWPRMPAPDVWISDGGTNAAYVQGQDAIILRPGVRTFASDVWSRRRGLQPVPRPDEGWTCDRFSCVPDGENGSVALWWGIRPPTQDQLSDLCSGAKIVSLRAPVRSLPAACQQRLVLDGADYATGGAVELWKTDAGWVAHWTSDDRGNRPWTVTGHGSAKKVQ